VIMLEYSAFIKNAEWDLFFSMIISY